MPHSKPVCARRTHTRSLLELRRILTNLSARAVAVPASPEQRSARRILVAITAGAAERVSDAEYLALIRSSAFRGELFCALFELCPAVEECVEVGFGFFKCRECVGNDRLA